MNQVGFGYAQLPLPRCPHCGIAAPTLVRQFFANTNAAIQTASLSGTNPRLWSAYVCSSCGGMVVAASANGKVTTEIFPSSHAFSDDIPDVPRDYLNQAAETLTSPRASVLMSAGAVDSMLKERGLKNGNLYTRIEDAVKAHMLTPEIGSWAHDVRLDANDQRHADEAAVVPTVEDATRCLEFAKALADTLFVLPARVRRGRDLAKATKAKETK